MVQNQFAFLRRSSGTSTRAALLFWKQSPEQIVQRAGCSPGLGGTLASACLLHWGAWVPVLLGEPRNGLGSGGNQSALLPLQGKSVAQCLKKPVPAGSCISSICSRVLTYWDSHSAELLMTCLLQNYFSKVFHWACSGYTECIISDLSNWDLSSFFGQFLFYKTFWSKMFSFFKTFSLKCQFKRKE